MPDSLISIFKEGLKQARKQRKSDDILNYMSSHWQLFCSSRKKMTSLMEELEGRDDLSVTSLAEALGLDSSIVFKKMKLVDAAKAFLDLPGSSIYGTFVRQLGRLGPGAGGSDPLLCIFVVAGDRSFVLTNQRTRVVPGLVRLCIPAEPGHETLELFPASQAQLRLPNLFTHEEN